jgi:serine/threonine-protein kinase
MFPAEPLPDKIGTYKIIRRLPSAGAAEVYLGRSDGPMGFQRECAIKVMPDTSEGNAQFAEEFSREAAICARLNHPAIVRVFDFFEHAGKLCLVVEHVEGTTIERLLVHLADQRQKLGDAAVFYIGARIAGALADAHAAVDEQGQPTPIVHRNLNPDNVLISVDGEVRLTGFGVGKILGRTPDTAIGKIKGTVGYMAPEQARGEGVTTKADVYGLGLLLWSLLSGRRPPTDGTWPRRVSNLRSDFPREVAALVDAALDHFPGTRKITAREIEQWLSKAAPAGRGKAELKERVASLRDSRAPTDSVPAPAPRGAMPAPGNPFQGVRFGAPPSSPATPAPTVTATGLGNVALAHGVRAGEPAVPAAMTTTAQGLGNVLNLPAPRPLESYESGPAAPRVSPIPGPVHAPPMASPVVPSPAPAPVVRFGPPPAVRPAGPVAPVMVPPVRFGPPPSPSSPEIIAPIELVDASPEINASLPPAPRAPLSTPPPALLIPREPSTGGLKAPGATTPAPNSVRFGAPAAPTPAPAEASPGAEPTEGGEAGPASLRKRAKSPLSAMGTIIVSAITATVVVAVGLYFFVNRSKGTPDPAASASASASAPPVTPRPTATATATAPPPPTATAAATTSVSAAELTYGFGYLTVATGLNANVFVSGKLAGPANQPLKVRCGRWYVRLAAAREGRYPEWVSAGETVIVACQDSTRIEMGRRP